MKDIFSFKDSAVVMSAHYWCRWSIVGLTHSLVFHPVNQSFQCPSLTAKSFSGFCPVFFCPQKSPTIISGLVKRDSYEPKMPVPVLSEADDKSLQQREASISGKRIKSSWRHLGSHPALHRTGAPVCLIRVDSRRNVWADHPAARGPPQTAQHRNAHWRRRRSLGRTRRTRQIKRTGSREHDTHALCLSPFLAFWSGSVRRCPGFFGVFFFFLMKCSTKRPRLMFRKAVCAGFGCPSILFEVYLKDFGQIWRQR